MFKVVYNDIVIDLLTEVKYFRYLRKSNKTAITDATSADGFYGSNDELFYLEGRRYPQDKKVKIVKLIEITPSEYSELQFKLKNNIKVEGNIASLITAKKNKIELLSKECNNKITDGVNVLLTDGKYYNFRLTIEDQINLIDIEKQLKMGIKEVIYHSTNSVCKLYSKEDMTKIIDAAFKHRKYHTTYFNLLKYCINNMNTVEEINNVSYGDDLLKFEITDSFKNFIKERLNV